MMSIPVKQGGSIMRAVPKALAARGINTVATRTVAIPRDRALSSLVPSRRRTVAPFPSLFDFDHFDDFFDRPAFAPPMPLLKDFERSANKMLRTSSPCYEVTEDDDEYQIAVDVPGVKSSDLNIQVEQGGRLLRLIGERKVREGNMESQTRFEKSFTMGRGIDSDKITANLADGVVVINVPKHPDESAVHKVPITEFARLDANERTDSAAAAEAEEVDIEEEAEAENNKDKV